MKQRDCPLAVQRPAVPSASPREGPLLRVTAAKAGIQKIHSPLVWIPTSAGMTCPYHLANMLQAKMLQL